MYNEYLKSRDKEKKSHPESLTFCNKKQVTDKLSIIPKPSPSTANMTGPQATIVREDNNLVRKFKGNKEEPLQDNNNNKEKNR